jgi:hypothetical protein
VYATWRTVWSSRYLYTNLVGLKRTRILLCFLFTHRRVPPAENPASRPGGPGPAVRPVRAGRDRPTAPMGRPGPAGRWRGFREHTIRLSAFPPERRPAGRRRGPAADPTSGGVRGRGNWYNPPGRSILQIRACEH